MQGRCCRATLPRHEAAGSRGRNSRDAGRARRQSCGGDDDPVAGGSADDRSRTGPVYSRKGQMRRGGNTLSRIVWMACACLCLLPRLAGAAEPSLAIDFDGDGRHDQVTLDGRQPFLLHIWLSRSGTTEVLHARAPLQRVAAIDLDGDRRPELIARDSESRIHVWTPRGKRFHRYRLRHTSEGLRSPTSHRIDGRDSEPAGVLPGSSFIPSALLRAAPHAPPDSASRVCAPQGTTSCHGSPAVQPFAPRPPPAPLPL